LKITSEKPLLARAGTKTSKKPTLPFNGAIFG
jgi:hypothetical protein